MERFRVWLKTSAIVGEGSTPLGERSPGLDATSSHDAGSVDEELPGVGYILPLSRTRWRTTADGAPKGKDGVCIVLADFDDSLLYERNWRKHIQQAGGLAGYEGVPLGTTTNPCPEAVKAALPVVC